MHQLNLHGIHAAPLVRSHNAFLAVLAEHPIHNDIILATVYKDVLDRTGRIASLLYVEYLCGD